MGEILYINRCSIGRRILVRLIWTTLTVLILGTILCNVVTPVRAQADFDTDAAIDYLVLGGVNVARNTTDVVRVSLLPGGRADDYLSLYNYGKATLSGGDVSGFVQAQDNSSFTLETGNISGDAYFGDATAAALLGGGVNGSVYATGDSAVRLTGTAIGNTVYAYENSQITMEGGTTRSLLTGNTALFTPRGGSTEEILAQDTARVFVYGGSPGTSLAAFDASVITIVGADLRLTESAPGTYFGFEGVRATLTGSLSDGAAFMTTAYALGGGQIVLRDSGVATAPEPGALSLFLPGAVCLLALIKRKRPPFFFN